MFSRGARRARTATAYGAADQTGCQCGLLSTAENTDNGHVSIRTGSRMLLTKTSKMCFFLLFYILGRKENEQIHVKKKEISTTRNSDWHTFWHNLCYPFCKGHFPQIIKIYFHTKNRLFNICLPEIQLCSLGYKSVVWKYSLILANTVETPKSSSWSELKQLSHKETDVFK